MRIYIKNETGICLVPNCDNEVAKNTLGKRYSSSYCAEHIHGIKIKCSDCNKEIIIKASHYNENKLYYCLTCSGRRIAIKNNNSPKGKARILNNFKIYRESDKAKKDREKNIKIIQDTYIGTPKHINQITKLGLKYGPLKIKRK